MSARAATGELGSTGEIVETMIPRRLDRLPWSRRHWLVGIGLRVACLVASQESRPQASR